MSCAAPRLLLAQGERGMERAYRRYPANYDDVFVEVGKRLRAAGTATKLDLAALIAWKHVRNAPWMTNFLTTRDTVIRSSVSAAFAADLTDAERVAALRELPGFRAGGAFTSVLFAAWNPSAFGVYDTRVEERRRYVVSRSCKCRWADLPTYWEHLRRIASEMPPGPSAWTPRTVEMAMMNLRSPTSV